MNIPFIAPKKHLKSNQDDEINYALFSAETIGGRNIKESNIKGNSYQFYNSGNAHQTDVEGNARQLQIEGNSKQIRIGKHAEQFFVGGDASQEFVGSAYVRGVKGNANQSFVKTNSLMNDIDGKGTIYHVKGTAYAGRIKGGLTIGDVETFKTDKSSEFPSLTIDGDVKNFEGECFVCPKYGLKDVIEPIIPRGHHASPNLIGSTLLGTTKRKPYVPRELKNILEANQDLFNILDASVNYSTTHSYRF